MGITGSCNFNSIVYQNTLNGYAYVILLYYIPFTDY